MRTIDNNALAETLFIIKCLPYNEQNKISKKFINFLEENKNDNYIVTINPNISLQNQELLQETKELLKEIYMSYFISKEEEKRIITYDNYKNMVEEDLKRKKYNYENIFKDKNIKVLQENKKVEIIEYKDSIFKRILNKLKSIFNKYMEK